MKSLLHTYAVQMFPMLARKEGLCDGSMQPHGKAIQASAVTGHRWEKERSGSPRTEVNCSVTHCIYENLWYNNGRFFLLVDGPHPVVGFISVPATFKQASLST
jgi:hypothetical protein